MANGVSTPGSAISSGIGRGSAQVFDTSGLVNMLIQKQNERKQKKARLDSQLRESLSDVDVSGVRKPDLPGITEGYNKLIGLYGDIINSEDYSDRAKKEAQFNAEKSRLLNKVGRSLEIKEAEKNLIDIGLRTPVNELSDNFSESLNKLRNTKMDSDQLDNLMDFTNYQRQAKPINLQSAFDDMATKSAQQFQTEFQGVAPGVIERTEGSKMNFDVFRKNFLQKRIQDDDFEDQVTDAYLPSFQNRTREDVIKETQTARALGITDYDPSSIDDFILLSNFAPRVGTEEFEGSKAVLRSVPVRGRSTSDGEQPLADIVSLDENNRPTQSSFSVAVKSSRGENAFVPGTTTSIMDVSLPVVRSQISIDPDVKAKNAGDQEFLDNIRGSEADFDYSSIRVIPVYKKGVKSSATGEGGSRIQIDLSGNPVDTSKLDQEISSGNVEFKPVIPGVIERQGEQVDVYIPAERKIQEVLLKASKDDASTIRSRWNQVQNYAKRQNSLIGEKSSKEPVVQQVKEQEQRKEKLSW